MLEHNNTTTVDLAPGQTSTAVSYTEALENYRKNTDWWVVFDSFDLPGNPGTPLWISQKTGIMAETVMEALEGLTNLGLLKNGASGLEKVKDNFTVPSTNQTKSQRMDEHALISRQILNYLNEDAKGAIRFASFASNIEVIAELYAKIDAALLEAQEISKRLPKNKLDNVYLASYTSVTAIPAQKGGRND